MKALEHYLRKFMLAFLDDFYLYSNFITHLNKLILCLEKCWEYNISLNSEKCLFLMFSGLILGYLVSKDGKFLDPKKIKVVQHMKQPKIPHDIQVFNGLAQFDPCFIWDYVGIIELITQLIWKSVEFIWSDRCRQSWEQIKQCYLEAPIPIPSRWNIEFYVHMDASNIAVGAMLAQNPIGKCDQLILYASRPLNCAKWNYIAIEREALAMFYALQKFQHYLLSNKVHFLCQWHWPHLSCQQATTKWACRSMASINFRVWFF